MTTGEIIGYSAAVLTTAAFFPQAMQTVRSRDVSSINPWSFGLFTVGVAMWLVYGVLRREWPVILANAITLLPAITICWMVLSARRRGPIPPA